MDFQERKPISYQISVGHSNLLSLLQQVHTIKGHLQVSALKLGID